MPLALPAAFAVGGSAILALVVYLITTETPDLAPPCPREVDPSTPSDSPSGSAPPASSSISASASASG